MFGSNDAANLDNGAMWPVAHTLTESRVYCAGARSSATGSFPAPSHASRPGGSEWAMAMMADRCASVIRCLRPAPTGSRARRRRLR